MLSWMSVRRGGDSFGNVSPNAGRHIYLVRIVRSVSVALAVALALEACGGGDGSGTAGSGTAGVETPESTLAVRVVDSGGQPVADVTVSLVGGFAEMARHTDPAGNATFEFIHKPVGDAVIEVADSSGYYNAAHHFLIDAVDGKVELSLVRRNQVTITANQVAAVASPDASTLTIDADISVADATGGLIGVLHLADFGVPSPDCNLGGDCFLDPPGKHSPINQYFAAPGQNPVSAAPLDPPPSATYRVRYVLVSDPGAFSAGRTVLSLVSVRLSPETVEFLDINVPL